MRLLAFSLALLLGSQSAAAQNDASIVGRVLAADTKQPLAGAQVSAVLLGRPPTAFAPLTAETDASGVYRLANLAPGRYSIRAQRVGYALPGVPTSQPPFVQVAAGQVQNAPDVLLERGGVIAGRVMDPTGQPLVDARVVAMRRMNYPGLGPRLMPTGAGAQTNDLGEFRLHSLPAGEYVVQSVPRMELGFMTASPTARDTAPAATYYPGTADEAGAHSVPLGAGQTVEGIVFSEVMVPVFQVSGVVVDETGAPVPEARVMLMPDFAAGGRSVGPGPRARADREGRFRIVNVANGAYVANASVPIVTQGGGGVGATSWTSGSVSGGASGGVSSAVTVESRNGVTTSYRPTTSHASRVKVAVQDGHVTDLRLVVRR